MTNVLAASPRKQRMSIAEAAAYLHAHPETVRKWIRQGKIPARRIGQLGNYILYEEELAKILDGDFPIEGNNST